MKRIYLIVLIIPLAWFIYAMNFADPWITDFELAKRESKESGKPILLYFSGSDWCSICLKLKKTLFEDDAFKRYSSDHLILMVADFPRSKKHQPDEKVKKQNDALSEQYNSEGIFPHLLLLNFDGSVLKEWKGDPNTSGEQFVEQIKNVANRYKTN